MKDIIFINSHPIQYFAPLYKYMNAHGVKTKAWYCSDESIKGGLDVQFGVDVKWDIPLLEGYEYKFFKNQSWKPSHFNGFFGLINLGMIRELFRVPKSVIVVHGYHYLTHMLVLMFAKLSGHTVCLRFELPLSHEQKKKGWKTILRKAIFKYIVFSPVNHFLYIGTQNRLFYKSYGIADHRLLFCPYSVDNARFQQENKILKQDIAALKEQIGIPANSKIILYSGKYIDKKRPMDLIRAFHQLNDSNCWLIMVGEGNLRNQMESFIAENNLKQVILTGFINQSKVPEYYAISDVFVMSSSVGETWGLSVNEAMNFGLPVIVSDLTGCSSDLVKQGDNGYTYQTGNVDELALKLKEVLIENKLSGKTSSESIVNNYSYKTVTENLRQLVA
jgi:glycosyltransferase involved in cell wall biosynthesis